MLACWRAVGNVRVRVFAGTRLNENSTEAFTVTTKTNMLDAQRQQICQNRPKEWQTAQRPTSCARKRSLVSSTASFFVVNVLSRRDVRRTDCALCHRRRMENDIKTKLHKYVLVGYGYEMFSWGCLLLRQWQLRLIYLVLLLCERRTRRRCASAKRLLSCSFFNCSIRSRISASSQISVSQKKILQIHVDLNAMHSHINKSHEPDGVSSFLFFAFKSAPLIASISKISIWKNEIE